MQAARCIAKIDSSSTMVQAAANHLRGKDISGMGFVPASRVMAVLANTPPKFLRKYVYIYGGRSEAAPPDQVAELDGEAMSRWVVEKYPARQYPAVAIGSSAGSLIHLCAALRIPWLPQTLLVPVRRREWADPDDLRGDMESFRAPARRFLERNPGLQVNQMHDPIQDRLMIQQMGYFRVKRLKLGETYERFLRRCLPPGGTVLIADCSHPWPMTQVGPRHYFQVGGYGGLSSAEYLACGPKVARFLKEQGARRPRWEAPEPDVTRPEAEWGFEPALLEDLKRAARRWGWRLKQLAFDDPADLSPVVADLYRAWYQSRGVPARRLLAESFLLLEPWWCLRTGAVPFWLVFNTNSSARELERYLRTRGPFDEIYLTLFANSVQGIDQTPLSRWKDLLRMARRRGGLIGVDEACYPFDLGVYFRFHPDLKSTLSERFPMPEPLTLDYWERFLERRPHDKRFIVNSVSC